MILLIAAAGSVAVGNELLANELGTYAYYFLVAGVILQIASYLEYGREESELVLTG